MNKQANYISNRLRLRDPQKKSLEIFEAICDKLELAKIVDLDKKESYLKQEIDKVRSISSTFEEFEREFCNICFSLATGVGKTRLMGAFIAYLYYKKGIKNFFVMAPNITIYNKLVADLSDINNPKYVFKGLDAFSSAPRIIHGENYEEFRNNTFGNNEVTINVFNIAKLNAESKGKKGQLPRIKRLNEVLGESYFEYLKNLDDLVLLMDESHHYRADRALAVINELNPILGIEVTATPQVQNGSRAIKFKNVVYEYSLAHALDDGKYIKVPYVATRENFISSQYNDEELDHIKLEDGVRVHIDTKAELEKYSRENGKRLIKPFILVVAKDTKHSAQIKEYIMSDNFFRGYYKDKVIEVNSNQSGIEKDINIQQLLSLEEYNNKIEIVIHVNMLKEGWDVNNLYTIIPLRASASETLTEQTIGRGLRLPYGERTGVEKLDRLTIIHHDKFQNIIELANDPNSLVRKYYYIDPNENTHGEEKKIITLPPVVEEEIAKPVFIEQISLNISDDVAETEQVKEEIATYMARVAHEAINELSKQVKNINEIQNEECKALVRNAVIQRTSQLFPNLKNDIQAATECAEVVVKLVSQLVNDKVIPIPQSTVQQILEIKQGFYDFDLDVRAINYRPSSEDIKMKSLGKEGKVDYLRSNNKAEEAYDTPEREIIKYIILEKTDVDYSQTSDLIYKLISQLQQHLSTYLNNEEIQQVLIQRKRDLGDIIYNQMKEHFYKEDIRFEASEMKPFSKIEMACGEKFESDSIYDFRVYIKPSEVVKKVFNGFSKSCHSMYKFKNNTEKTFTIILEDDSKVLRWMCPAQKQFKLYWDRESKHNYQPDFVVETEKMIYIVETKDRNKVKDEVVQLKAQAAMEYCRAATEFNLKYGGKSWAYALIPDEAVDQNRSFEWLISNSITYKDRYENEAEQEASVVVQQTLKLK
ncbi:MAG: type III restriction endonuclease subunit R [Cellulosilyticum sp.]|nr:type III restriction endonuclease subunit R [Cellulosilyticum sp.]